MCPEGPSDFLPPGRTVSWTTDPTARARLISSVAPRQPNCDLQMVPWAVGGALPVAEMLFLPRLSAIRYDVPGFAGFLWILWSVVHNCPKPSIFSKVGFRLITMLARRLQRGIDFPSYQPGPSCSRPFREHGSQNDRRFGTRLSAQNRERK